MGESRRANKQGDRHGLDAHQEAAPGVAETPRVGLVPVGATVWLANFTGKNAESNGRKGSILGYDEQKQRYRVRLFTGDERNLKKENLVDSAPSGGNALGGHSLPTHLLAAAEKAGQLVEDSPEDLKSQLREVREREWAQRMAKLRAEKENGRLAEEKAEAERRRVEAEEQVEAAEHSAKAAEKEAKARLARLEDQVKQAAEKEASVQQQLRAALREKSEAEEELQQVRRCLFAALAPREVASPVEAAPDERFLSCPTYQKAAQAKRALGIDSRIFDPRWDRCYCRRCYPEHFVDTIGNDGPTEYVIPRGFVRFGLKVPAYAEVKDVFKRWCVSFHGLRQELVKPILEDGGTLLMPGDKLSDGTVLKSARCAGRQDHMIYTSPTSRYAGLQFYAKPRHVAGTTNLMAQMMFQCRQKPDTYSVKAETMKFRQDWGAERLCPHVHYSVIEWVTECRQTVIPYGLMVRTYPEGQPPVEPIGELRGSRWLADGFHSPVDKNNQ